MSAQVQTVITATEHNQSYSAALDVLGLGENGWGLPLIPVIQGVVLKGYLQPIGTTSFEI